MLTIDIALSFFGIALLLALAPGLAVVAVVGVDALLNQGKAWSRSDTEGLVEAIVVEEKDAGYTYYRVPATLAAGPHGTLWRALEEQFAASTGEAAVRADESRLQEVLRLRKENFDTHGAADTRDARQLVPGRSWAAWSRALGMLLPPITIADLGCGEGYLSIEAARWAKQVIAVDRSDVVLDRAKALGRRRRVNNIVWKRGELEKLPLKDHSVDVALLSQASIKDSRRTMDDLVREAIGKLGENIVVRRIARFEVGESLPAETAATE